MLAISLSSETLGLPKGAAEKGLQETKSLKRFAPTKRTVQGYDSFFGGEEWSSGRGFYGVL